MGKNLEFPIRIPCWWIFCICFSANSSIVELRFWLRDRLSVFPPRLQVHLATPGPPGPTRQVRSTWSLGGKTESQGISLKTSCIAQKQPMVRPRHWRPDPWVHNYEWKGNYLSSSIVLEGALNISRSLNFFSFQTQSYEVLERTFWTHRAVSLDE